MVRRSPSWIAPKSGDKCSNNRQIRLRNPPLHALEEIVVVAKPGVENPVRLVHPDQAELSGPEILPSPAPLQRFVTELAVPDIRLNVGVRNCPPAQVRRLRYVQDGSAPEVVGISDGVRVCDEEQRPEVRIRPVLARQIKEGVFRSDVMRRRGRQGRCRRGRVRGVRRRWCLLRRGRFGLICTRCWCIIARHGGWVRGGWLVIGRLLGNDTIEEEAIGKRTGHENNHTGRGNENRGSENEQREATALQCHDEL